ncbi:hypothetical protein N0V93_004169 [Gnomoniopsis smithogilvyi]|uniref:Hydrophobic surface binding protein A-domain-containing protein n=1 Tax=Gnomoniopsis smithogilvyi TaxID=1191159 RepID=A0A9W9CVY4_9PEZI|nr:hypothetical protein N0V93_004169 [Gnomoniopsis smithogilvyi]
MVNLYSAFFFVTAISASVLPLGRRDVTTVLDNLETIDTQTKALTTSITSWDGSLLGALGIASASNSLGTAIDNANTEAATEAQLSSADSQTVLTYVSGTLTSDVNTALTTLNGRESDVAALGVQSLVLGQIQTLQSKTAAYGATLVSITSADLQAQAQTQVDALDAAFDSAVAVYS